MCLLWSTKWVFMSQKTTFFIVTAVKTANLKPHSVNSRTELPPKQLTVRSFAAGIWKSRPFSLCGVLLYPWDLDLLPWSTPLLVTWFISIERWAVPSIYTPNINNSTQIRAHLQLLLKAYLHTHSFIWVNFVYVLHCAYCKMGRRPANWTATVSEYNLRL
jgi:hypothetical protein